MERGNVLPITDPGRLVVEDCCTCGVFFALPQRLVDQRRFDGKSFFCPNGHSMVFKNSERDALLARAKEAERREAWEKQRREYADEARDRARAQRDHAERQRNGMKGALTRVKRRIAAGVCPCCNRTFTDLARHMTTKHPSYSSNE